MGLWSFTVHEIMKKTRVILFIRKVNGWQDFLLFLWDDVTGVRWMCHEEMDGKRYFPHHLCGKAVLGGWAAKRFRD